MKRFWVSCLAVVLTSMVVGGAANAGGDATRIRAQLAGAAINGMVPKGRAEFRARATASQLTVQVEDVNLPDGTVLNVLIDNSPVGQITISLLRGEIQLNTGDGATLPPIGLGTAVVVADQAGRTIVAGVF
ncbi:MAG TPA: hypothetical protein VNN73_21620 [Blastocatellia bacterium]|nr:hypothetical protein [Blastocatellia bacterium]